MRPYFQLDMDPGVYRDEKIAAAIRAIVPDGFNQYGQFVWKFYEEDCRLSAVLAILQTAGIVDRVKERATGNTMWNSRFYSVMRRREYSADEYVEAQYLWSPRFEEDLRIISLVPDLLDGTAVLASENNLVSRKVVAREHECWFVGTGFKAVMEAEEFVGLSFKSTMQSRTREPEHPGEKYPSTIFEAPPETAMWQLSSTIELPPMYTPETMRRPTGLPGIDPLPAGARGPGEFLNPGFTDHAQLTYTRAAIESVGAFDVAYTWEYITPTRDGRPHRPSLVLSQRFYQFCKKHDIKATFIPLRIIEDKQAGK